MLDALLPLLQEQVDAGLVDVKLGTRMTRLETQDRRVTAVTLETPDGTTVELEAEDVVLTTGGYAGNPDLFPRLLSEGSNGSAPAGSMYYVPATSISYQPICHADPQ